MKTDHRQIQVISLLNSEDQISIYIFVRNINVLHYSKTFRLNKTVFLCEEAVCVSFPLPNKVYQGDFNTFNDKIYL